MVPPAGFEPASDALEERCLNPLDHGGMLLFIRRLLFYPFISLPVLLLQLLYQCCLLLQH